MDRPTEVGFSHHAVPPVGVCVYETEFETSLYSGLNVYNPNDILLQNCKIESGSHTVGNRSNINIIFKILNVNIIHLKPCVSYLEYGNALGV